MNTSSPAMNLQDRQKQIIQEFEGLSGWEERYKKIIEIGKGLASMPDELKDDDHIVKGCQSKVWIEAHLDEHNRVQLRADSDALIVRGLVALLLRVYSGSTPEEILQTPPEFIATLGFADNLSPSRANGLNAMLKQIKYYAMAFQALVSASTT